MIPTTPASADRSKRHKRAAGELVSVRPATRRARKRLPERTTGASGTGAPGTCEHFSFALLATTSTMEADGKTFGNLIWAVPAFRRVEPAVTPGATTATISCSTERPSSDWEEERLRVQEHAQRLGFLRVHYRLLDRLDGDVRGSLEAR